jgi:hypothetical protein
LCNANFQHCEAVPDPLKLRRITHSAFNLDPMLPIRRHIDTATSVAMIALGVRPGSASGTGFAP